MSSLRSIQALPQKLRQLRDIRRNPPRVGVFCTSPLASFVPKRSRLSVSLSFRIRLAQEAEGAGGRLIKNVLSFSKERPKIFSGGLSLATFRCLLICTS
jgi:hypothetical protein